MLTAEQLQSIMPRLSDARNSEFLPFLAAAMAEFAIEAPARAAAFLAQLAHESGQFRFMEEIWGPTDAQRRYEPVTKLSQALGNTSVGDGKRFKGRGPIQLTGRANYQRFGDLLSVDLLADPPRAANPSVAFRAAGLFWSKKGLNELADVATPPPRSRKSRGGSTAAPTAWPSGRRSTRSRARYSASRTRPAREPARRCQPTNRPSSAAGRRFAPKRVRGQDGQSRSARRSAGRRRIRARRPPRTHRVQKTSRSGKKKR
jgi:putative chitinase